MILHYETNNTLYHHGVKGMKWGRRKGRTNSIKKQSKLQEIKDREISIRKKDLKRHNKDIAQYDKHIKDMEKRGEKSNYYKSIGQFRLDLKQELSYLKEQRADTIKYGRQYTERCLQKLEAIDVTKATYRDLKKAAKGK